MGALISHAQVLSRVAAANLSVRLVEYAGRTNDYSVFACDAGHTWQAPLYRILAGHGCSKCSHLRASIRNRYTIEWYRSKLPPELECLSDDYVNVFTLMPHRCVTCDYHWNTAPHAWLQAKRACPKCGMRRKARTGGYSFHALDWIEATGKQLRLNFQHMENVGEFRIPSPLSRKRYSLDGYNPHYKLALEYFGDYWHRRGDAYEHTLQRLNYLLSLGFGVIFIWEKQYHAGEQATFVNPYRRELRGLADRGSFHYLRTKQLVRI